MNVLRLTTVFLIGSLASASAEVIPNGLFSDHAILQQEMEVPVWGTARDGETVTVEIAGQKETATAKDGKWMVRLKNLQPGGPYSMKIAGDNVITLQDILVGEVWVCSGQSNMARTLVPPAIVQPRLPIWEQDAAEANFPQIRQYRVYPKMDSSGTLVFAGTWTLCSPETAKDFTAVGYYFARDIHKTLNRPVGLISTAVGATGGSAWTSREALAANPELHRILDWHEKEMKEYPAALEKYKAEEAALMAKYTADLEKAQKEGTPLPRKPTPPGDPATNVNGPGYLYATKIVPLQPFAIRGFLWYQGEQNSGHAAEYRILFPALINDWRKAWGEGDIPFLFVQLAPYIKTGPEIRESQLLTWLKTPNTSMVVTTDCGDANNIHPGDKRPVGARMALAARALAYGEKMEYSGPVYDGMTVDGSRAVLRFKHVGGGLIAKEGDLKGFTSAGADKNFLPAKAEIKGDTVIVSNENVALPTAVRFGWENVPEGNLYNREGLPASPFRTDVK